MTEKNLIVWADVDYALRWWPTEGAPDYVIDFEVIVITGYTENSATKEFDVPMYAKRGATTSGEPADSLDDAEVAVSGSIKWDGCSRITFPSVEDCMMHFCGRASWLSFAEMMVRVFDTLAPKVPKHDAECAGMKPKPLADHEVMGRLTDDERAQFTDDKRALLRTIAQLRRMNE